MTFITTDKRNNTGILFNGTESFKNLSPVSAADKTISFESPTNCVAAVASVTFESRADTLLKEGLLCNVTCAAVVL